MEPEIEPVNWNTMLWEPLKQNSERLASFMPHIVNAIYILAIGWIAAFVAQLAVRQLLKLIKFDKIADKTGIEGTLNEFGIQMNPAEWLSRLMFWIVMITALAKALFELRLGDVAVGVDFLAGFVIQGMGLLVIFILGVFMSVVLSRIIQTTSANLKVKSPGAYSRVMKWTVLVFTTLLVLRQISIPIYFVIWVLGAVFVSLCIAFIIAFGVGGRDWAARILERISK